MEKLPGNNTGGSGEEIPKYLTPVIQQHSVVFEEPRGLPPSRGHEPFC